MSSNYDIGTRAWQPDATEGWVASEVIKKSVDGSKVTLVFKLDNGEVSHHCAESCTYSHAQFPDHHLRRKRSRSLRRPYRAETIRHYLR